MRKIIFILCMLTMVLVSADTKSQIITLSGPLTVNKGETALYTVSVSNYSNLLLQWEITGGIISTSQVCSPVSGMGSNVGSTQCSNVNITWNGSTPSGKIKIQSSGGFNATFDIVVIQPLSIGSLSPDRKILAYNTSAGTLVCAVATGGTGTYDYVWEKSDNGFTWINVGPPFASAPFNYVTPQLKNDAWYRCKVTSGSRTVYSNSMYIQVCGLLDPGVITSSQVLLSNSLPARLKGSSAKGEEGKFTYQWQQSFNGTTWTDIANTNTADYLPPPVTAQTWFRRKVVSDFVSLGQSNTAYSNVISIGVRTNNGGNIPAPFTHSYNQPQQSVGDMPYFQTNRLNRSQEVTINKEGITQESQAASLGVSDVATDLTYTDGLGRSVQQISKQGSPLQNDIILPAKYEPFTSLTAGFLPYSDGAGTGDFRTNAGTTQYDFYKVRYPDQNFFYQKEVMESIPSQSPVGVYAPGDAYAGRQVGSGRIEFRHYQADERVLYWTIQNKKPVINGDITKRYYGNADLFVQEGSDMYGRKTLAYIDHFGRVVLEKTQLVDFPMVLSNDQLGLISDEWLVTINVYDEFGRLRFVIPPLATQRIYESIPPFTIPGMYTLDEVIQKLCIRKEYDVEGRLIENYNPEAGAEYYVYDKAGRIVLTQDSLRRSKSQWLFSRYDERDRTIITGIYNNSSNRETLQAQAGISMSFPVIDAAATVLRYNFFDDYNFAEASLKPFNTSHISNLANGINGIIPVKSSHTTGLMTGTKLRVLKPAGFTGGPDWITEVNYYDDRGRLLQVVKDNPHNSLTYISHRYNFSGQIISSFIHVNNPHERTGHQVTSITRRYVYDHAGRLKETFQKLNNETSDRSIARKSYDETGMLEKTVLGNQLDSLEYTYDLQGRMIGINANYVENKAAGHYFGSSYSFENGFTNQITDGGLSGVKWRTKGVEDTAMAFGFVYDNADRMIKSGFYKKPGASSWGQANENYSTDTITYDVNGNIKSLKATGTYLGTTKSIDNLTMDYFPNSNRLKQVADAAGDQKIFDFKDSVVVSGTDYLYDVNGNMISDANKGIMISYNDLDKPDQITFYNNPSKFIRFVYDAAGTRIFKVYSDADRTDTVTYTESFQFKDDTLRFFSLSTGRVRRTTENTLTYDYFIYDAAGNVRSVLTEERDTASYVSTFETAGDATEPALFGDKRNATKEPIPSYEPFYNASTNKYFSRLNGQDAARKVGPSLILKAMAGDTIAISVKGYYKNNELSSGGSPAQQVVESILSAILGSSTTVLDNGKGNLLSGNNAILNTADLYSFISGVQNNNTSNAVPRAYLNWIFFDENFNMVTSGVRRINMPDQMTTYSSQLVVPKNGFLYVFTNNESPMNVFFDDLSVQHFTGPLLQENSYYATGMVIKNLSSVAALRTANEQLYQSKLFDTENDLDWYYFDARYYDPQLARWHSPDPADQFVHLTPYAAMGNRWPMYVDKDGRWIHIVVGAVLGGVINVITHAGKIKNFGDGLKAFGIGAAAGAIGAATGGASLAATGLSGATMAGGFVAGVTGSAVASPIMGVGNMVAFGDEYSLKHFGRDVAIGGIGGAVVGGVAGLFKGKPIPIGSEKGRPVVNGNGYRTPSGKVIRINPQPTIRAGWETADGKFLKEFAGYKVGDIYGAVDDVASAAAKAGSNFLKFVGDEAVEHFGKHAGQIMKVTGKSAYNLKDYVDDANWIIKNGTYSTKLNGYYHYIGNAAKGESLFGFVGLKNGGSAISTFHIKTATQLGLK